MKFLVGYILLVACVSHISSLKLLLVFPPPAKSHYTLGNELGKGLARAGHEVTVISRFTEKSPPKGYREIVLSEPSAFKEKKKGNNRFKKENAPAMLQLGVLNSVSSMMSDGFFDHPKIQKLLKSDEHFDVVIVEQFFNDGMKIFAHHFKAHLIVFSAVGSNRLINHLVGNPEPPSTTPHVLLPFTGDMNFFQRMFNFLFGIMSDLYLNFIFYPQQNAILKKHFQNAPDIYELQHNVSLVLLNSHESVTQPVPRIPNMIDIGGFHVSPPKELPKDLKDFMDNAKDGVIYFSMGSNLVPSDMPKEKKDALLKVLGSRKENVLWKWDEDSLENKLDNMMISKWFPQQSILAHPNCKLFITHGGLLSTIETVYLGVPILAIPIFGDQKLNAARAASLGYGKSLSFSELNENELSKLIDELITNPSYQENVKTRSKIMHDRPVKPMDLAEYWIEYVVRHNGAPHLRVAGITLPFYKYYMLDVFAVLLAGIVLVKYLLTKIICRCFRKSKKSRINEKEGKFNSKKKRGIPGKALVFVKRRHGSPKLTRSLSAVSDLPSYVPAGVILRSRADGILHLIEEYAPKPHFNFLKPSWNSF